MFEIADRVSSFGPWMALCEQCGKLFKRVSGLNQHLSQVHNHSDSIIFKCGICAKTFTRKSSLKRHLSRPRACSRNIDMDTKSQVVYTPGNSSWYEDVSSDEEDFQQMIREEQPVVDAHDDDNFSVDTDVLDAAMKESGEFVENIVNEFLGDFESPDVEVENSVAPYRPLTCYYSDVSDDEKEEDFECAPEGNFEEPRWEIGSVTTTVALTLKRKETFYSDQTVEVERDTIVGHSENIRSEDIDWPSVAQDILNEIPVHIANNDARFVFTNSDDY